MQVSNLDENVHCIKKGEHFNSLNFIVGVKLEKMFRFISRGFTKILEIHHSDFVDILRGTELQFEKFMQLKHAIEIG